AVQKSGAMHERELLGGERQRFERLFYFGSALDQIVEAFAFDELAHHERPAAAGQSSETNDARHAEPLETGKRYRFANQRRHLALTGAFGEHLERETLAAMSIANRPDFAPATLP